MIIRMSCTSSIFFSPQHAENELSKVAMVKAHYQIKKHKSLAGKISALDTA